MKKLPKINNIVKKYNLSAKKSLGQNYIFDLNLTEKIVESCGNLKNFTVVEIGPGPGSLTRSILKSEVKKVVAIEIDRVTVAQLEHGDIGEDAAATKIANLLEGAGVFASDAFTGRVNLIARFDGLIKFERKIIETLNLVDESITVATASNYERTAKNNIVATIKIIPFAVKVSLKVVATDTESNTASTAMPFNLFCSCKGIPNFLYVSSNLGSKSSKFFGFSLKLLGAE